MNPIQNSITNATSGSVRSVGTGAPRGGKVAVPQGSSTSSSSDTVSISASARQLNAAAADSSAGASSAHVEALKSALAAGQYTVDPRKIAQGLVRDSRALQNASGG